jgi:GH15 family glucan-1,4-alpha-glucosidase
MLHASRLTRPRLRVVYDVLGGSDLDERERPDLPGYRGSAPVRVGNAAADQFQLDAYAWMLDAGWAYLSRQGTLDAETWRALRGHADVLAERWWTPDHGIWEMRERRAHYVHSKVMAWVGLDRAIRLAERLGAPKRAYVRWVHERERVAAAIRARGFDDATGSYTQEFGTSEPDASLLALATTDIESPTSPRVRGTIEAIRSRLSAGGPLLFRFAPDGEGAFLPCSFWLVRALVAVGEIDEAREVLEQSCARATDLGLFAEEMDPSTGDHLGNFPQAFTHSALVEAAAAVAEGERLRESGTSRVSLRT